MNANLSFRRGRSGGGIRRVAGFAAAAGILLAVAGCRSQRIALSPAQEAVRDELSDIDPTADPVVARTQVIDAHTHTFNARYLPLRGIVLGRRDGSPFAWLVSDRCAEVLAQAIAGHTPLAAGGNQPAVAPDTGPRPPTGPVCRLLLKALDKVVKAGDRDAAAGLAARMKQVDAVADSMSPIERAAVMEAMRMMGVDDHLKDVPATGQLRAAARFLWMLTRSDGDMIDLFREAHRGAPGPGPPGMLIHMIDFAPVYDQVPDGRELLDFERAQIRRLERFVNRAGPQVHYFVAYNPFRDHWRGGKPGDSLRLVREAVENHGARGVKIYPPSGYRPAGNDVPARPRSWPSRWPGRQWDGRYAGFEPGASRALDRAMEDLLEWCTARDLPVFVHSGYGEFEARKGYGRYHSDPAFWRQYLESHPEPDGSPCRLRLCFGHAGGHDYWFGGGELADWGRAVYDMCVRFPNVYCEVTASAELTDSAHRAWFADRLLRSFAASRAAGRFPFARKILYGSDWYLPDPADPADVLRAAQTVFLHPGLRKHYADYFRNNVLRFLNSGR